MNTETLSTCPINITPAAIAEIKNLYTSENVLPGQSLRIGVKGGGCSGLSYILEFDFLKENDNSYLMDGVEILIEKPHLLYVMGMSVDYGDGLNARGFTYTNPNAKETCGCGVSFSA